MLSINKLSNLLNIVWARLKTDLWLFILAALVLLLIIVTRLNVPEYLLDFSVIHHSASNQDQMENTPAAILDALLLEHHKKLPYQPLVRAALLQPPQEKIIQSFWIDSCSVSQGDLYRFIQWQRINKDSVGKAKGVPTDWQYQSMNQDHRILGRLDIPANGISWYEADAYCRAHNGRLPTLTEYQAITTGTSGNLYPWGNQPSTKFWPYLDPMLNAIQKCGTQPQAATPESNIHDLGHGMLEWVSRSNEQAALMGGGVLDKPHVLYALNFVNRAAKKTERIKYAGFRCAYDQKPAADKSSSWRTEREPIMVRGGNYMLGPPEKSRIVQLLKITQPEEWFTLSRLLVKSKEKSEKFAISRCEITRRQYRYFLADPLVKLGFFNHKLQAKDWQHRPLNWHLQLDNPDLPVVGVAWWSAYAFAKWVGGRLPTLEEWRTTASGSGKNIYPWGNNREDRQQFIAQNKQASIQACASNALDLTASGVNDMAGNVSEWSHDIARIGDGYGFTIAGGNYMLPADKTSKITQYTSADPEYRSVALGFRVVRD